MAPRSEINCSFWKDKSNCHVKNRLQQGGWKTGNKETKYRMETGNKETKYRLVR